MMSDDAARVEEVQVVPGIAYQPAPGHQPMQETEVEATSASSAAAELKRLDGCPGCTVIERSVAARSLVRTWKTDGRIKRVQIALACLPGFDPLLSAVPALDS